MHAPRGSNNNYLEITVRVGEGLDEGGQCRTQIIYSKFAQCSVQEMEQEEEVTTDLD